MTRSLGAETGFVLEGVVLESGGHRILDGVSARFPEGVCTAVTGPSGSGKSGLLRLLNRLAEPNAGTIQYGRVPLHDHAVRTLRRRVALVAQRPVLLTDDVAAELRVGRPELTDAEAFEALEAAGLAPGFLSRATNGLSGGEAQRVCIARTLAVKPNVLLLDEPTSALDELSTQAIERTASDFVAKGGTVILVSHRADQVRRLAHTAYVLSSGHILESGPPTTLPYLTTPNETS